MSRATSVSGVSGGLSGDTLTSVNGRRWLALGPVHLPRLNPFRCVSCTNPCTKPAADLRGFSLPEQAAHAPPGWSSRHRRPTQRGAGQAAGVKMERPTGRTTLTPAAWPARLCLSRW